MQTGLGGAEVMMVTAAIGALREQAAASGDHPDAIAARWFRLLAGSMRLAAQDLSATAHCAPLARQAVRLDEYADHLDTRRPRHLRLVGSS